MSIIEVNKLTRDYGDGKGVFDVSFSLEAGEAFGFLGPNGAGKTTTIRHLMGFLRPKAGRCTIAGMDCWKDSARIQRQLGYIPGEINFFDDMTGLAYLSFIIRYRCERSRGDERGVPRRGDKRSVPHRGDEQEAQQREENRAARIETQTARMQSLLTRFELDARGRINKMSKGMKQKVGIVAAFMHDPAILILDEPTSGLDPLMQNRFVELIQEEKARGKTILLSSHMFEEVERTCNRVGIIRGGKLAAVDTISALKAAQIKRYVVTLATEAEAVTFAKEPLHVIDVSHNHVTVTVQQDMAAFIAAMGRHSHSVTNISAPEQRLEEIFMQYYGGKNYGGEHHGGEHHGGEHHGGEQHV